MVSRDQAAPLIAIIDLDMGNLHSVANAVSQCGFDAKVVSASEDLDAASHLVIPGVGSFVTAMERMRRLELVEPIRRFAETGRPVLGICLGMQLLGSKGTEGGECEGLGLVPGTVVRLDEHLVPAIPHVGWNDVRVVRLHPVLERVKSGVDFYFVHSYHLLPDHPEHLVGVAQYGEIEVAAIVATENVVGFQFHPEKSQSNGLKLLESFCEWNPRC